MLLQMTLSHSFLWQIFHCVYIYHIIFIHSSVHGYLGYFHVLAIVNSAAVNIGVLPVSFRIIVLSRYMPRSGIAGSYGNSTFSFLRNVNTEPWTYFYVRYICMHSCMLFHHYRSFIIELINLIRVFTVFFPVSNAEIPISWLHICALNFFH